MAKTGFSEINVRAATITGTVIGFLCWLLVIPLSLSSYMMSTFASPFHTFSLLSLVAGIFGGALVGWLVAIIYNWALKLK